MCIQSEQAKALNPPVSLDEAEVPAGSASGVDPGPSPVEAKFHGVTGEEELRKLVAEL